MGIYTESGTFFGTYIDASSIEHLREEFTKDWDFDDLDYEYMKIFSNAGITTFGQEIEAIGPGDAGKIPGKKWISLVLTTEHYDGDITYFLGVKLDDTTAKDWEKIMVEAWDELDEVFKKLSTLKAYSTYETESLVYIF